MELDYIILWKAKTPNSFDLQVKVEEMLTLLFVMPKNGFIEIRDKKGVLQEISYKCKSIDKNKVCLKFESPYSEAKSAELLSKIPPIICKGEHRQNYSIICTYDEVSLSYCCKLMKPFGTFERRLRELVYLITVKAFGVDWVKKSFPEDMISEIKERSHGKITDEKLTELVLELLDYNDIINYLFAERYFDLTPEQVLNNELSVDKLENLSKDRIVSILSRGRKNSLWNTIFSNNENLNFMNQDDMNKLRTYRNDIMHHHSIGEDKFILMRREIKQANTNLLNAITEMENKIYTTNEQLSVYSSGYGLLYDAFDKLSHLFYNVSFDIFSQIGESMKKLFDTILQIKPNISKIYENLFKDNAFTESVNGTQTQMDDFFYRINESMIISDVSDYAEKIREATEIPKDIVYNEEINKVKELPSTPTDSETINDNEELNNNLIP